MTKKHSENPYPISDDDSLYITNPHHGISRRVDQHPFRYSQQQEEAESTTKRRPRPTQQPTTDQNIDRPPRSQPTRPRREEPRYKLHNLPVENSRARPARKQRTGCGWTLPLGLGMLIMLGIWVGIKTWNQHNQDQAQQQAIAADARIYGSPRTFTIMGPSVEYRSVNKAENDTTCTIVISRSNDKGKTWTPIDGFQVKGSPGCSDDVGVLKLGDVNHDKLPDITIIVKRGLEEDATFYLINDGKGGYRFPQLGDNLSQ